MNKIKYNINDIIEMEYSEYDWAQKGDLFIVVGYGSEFNRTIIELTPVRKTEDGKFVSAPEIITNNAYRIESNSIKIAEKTPSKLSNILALLCLVVTISIWVFYYLS